MLSLFKMWNLLTSQKMLSLLAKYWFFNGLWRVKDQYQASEPWFLRCREMMIIKLKTIWRRNHGRHQTITHWETIGSYFYWEFILVHFFSCAFVFAFPFTTAVFVLRVYPSCTLPSIGRVGLRGQRHNCLLILATIIRWPSPPSTAKRRCHHPPLW